MKRESLSKLWGNRGGCYLLCWWKMRALQGEAEQLHSLCASQEGAAAPNPGLGALQEMEDVAQGVGRVLRSSWELVQAELGTGNAMP